MNEIKYVDLFAGLGGMRIGFEKALSENGLSFKCVFTSEIKKHALEALNINFNGDCKQTNITKIHSDDIPDFDFLLAGFPCQAFSTAGSRKGFLDTRGTLFFEIERILKDKKPQGFILENVEGLISHDKIDKSKKYGRTFETILNTLHELGYFVSWEILDSKYFGVAQSRKRVYIVGSKIENINLKNFETKQIKLDQILEKNIPVNPSKLSNLLLTKFSKNYLYGKKIKDKRGGENNIHSWDLELKGSLNDDQKKLMNLLIKERRKKIYANQLGIKWYDGMPLTFEQIKSFYEPPKLKIYLDDLVNKNYLKLEKLKLKNDDYLNKNLAYGYNIVSGKLSYEYHDILDINGVAPTLVATDINKLAVLEDDGLRQLTIKESLRLFGYPDDYNLDIFDTKEKKKYAFDLLGNTVVVPVIYEISKRLIQIHGRV